VTVICILEVLAFPCLYTKSAGSLQESLSKTPQNLDIIDFIWLEKASFFLTFHISKKFHETPKPFMKSSNFMNIAMYS
jgi:hypothetical protein